MSTTRQVRVYIVLKNADMTEGRGPMVIDSVWKDRAEAVEYVNTKLGVMGRSPFYTNHVTGHVSTGWDDQEAWPFGGDWTIKDMELREKD